jgi:threonine dehydrogenase-like Zn-dependent dehydrogenase
VGLRPVGQFAIASAFLLGAERVIAIDRFPERLAMAAANSDAETIDYENEDHLFEALREMTGGRGPDACIDAWEWRRTEPEWSLRTTKPSRR